MNKNIEHYVFHKENFLNEKYCENCIDELNKCTWKKHEWYYSTIDSFDKKSGDNESEVIMDDAFSKNIGERNNFILDKLHSIILEYIESFNFPCQHQSPLG